MSLPPTAPLLSHSTDMQAPVNHVTQPTSHLNDEAGGELRRAAEKSLQWARTLGFSETLLQHEPFMTGPAWLTHIKALDNESRVDISIAKKHWKTILKSREPERYGAEERQFWSGEEYFRIARLYNKAEEAIPNGKRKREVAAEPASQGGQAYSPSRAIRALTRSVDQLKTTSDRNSRDIRDIAMQLDEVKTEAAAQRTCIEQQNQKIADANAIVQKQFFMLLEKHDDELRDIRGLAEEGLYDTLSRWITGKRRRY